ncbi:hypothetical protein [Cognatishimia sp.]|uniref:hypothetical protein n=1 Tax=Cognatishimia sp. TaxID=2211648 RepID=UPI003514EB97
MLNVARIDHAVEHVRHLLLADLSIGQVFWKLWLGFQETLDVRLSRETARGITFQRFLDDGCRPPLVPKTLTTDSIY